MFIVSPSVLAADFAKLGDELKKIEKAGAEYAHLDVMDGIFVPNISFGAPMISSIRKASSLIFDVHLMITEPQRYVDDFIKAGADILTIHYESCENPLEVVRYIKSKECKVGLSIKPATPAEAIYDMLPELDMLLVMTVEPGFGGQKMMPDMLEKVRKIRKYANEKGIKIDIEVDGGLTADNVGLATAAGANVIVAGSAVYNAKSPKEVIKKMKEAALSNPFVD
ncbi:MAG: ribulose-phosphate 3-epimerase [Clostridia bacterium]|nr:ribulose-phosphate 3-epimerase [Clostridia bacterium]